MGYEDFKPRSRSGRSRGGPSKRGSFGDGRKGRGGRPSSRDSDRRGPRRELQMTEVTCSDCGEKCEVPFKPTSSKPVFCRDCFDKKGGKSSGGPSNKDLDAIHDKLKKIMKALKIE